MIGCALMRALAGTARLPLMWLHLKAILIVWLPSFVQAQHLHQMLKMTMNSRLSAPSHDFHAPSPPHRTRSKGGVGGWGCCGGRTRSFNVCKIHSIARATTVTPSAPAAAHRHNPCPSPLFFFPHPLLSLPWRLRLQNARVSEGQRQGLHAVQQRRLQHHALQCAA